LSDPVLEAFRKEQTLNRDLHLEIITLRDLIKETGRFFNANELEERNPKHPIVLARNYVRACEKLEFGEVPAG